MTMIRWYLENKTAGHNKFYTVTYLADGAMCHVVKQWGRITPSCSHPLFSGGQSKVEEGQTLGHADAVADSKHRKGYDYIESARDYDEADESAFRMLHGLPARADQGEATDLPAAKAGRHERQESPFAGLSDSIMEVSKMMAAATSDAQIAQAVQARHNLDSQLRSLREYVANTEAIVEVLDLQIEAAIQ